MNIAICEDNGIVALDIKNSLHRLGYKKTIIISSGEDLLDYLQTEIPSLIIMDIMVGGKISGPDALKTVLKKYNVPIIIINGINKDSHPELKNRPEIIIIKKPFSLNDFKEAMERLLKPDPS